MSNSINALPSTSDWRPPIAGGQDDPVLTILETARKRYQRRGTKTDYVAVDGSVCAVGAVIAATGITGGKFIDSGGNSIINPSDEIGIDVTHVLKRLEIESEIISAAQTSIQMLNAAARRLYPDVVNEELYYAKPIEALNQDDSLPWRKRRQMVLECYDAAIAKRMAA